jgi:hypothetical protein
MRHTASTPRKVRAYGALPPLETPKAACFPRRGGWRRMPCTEVGALLYQLRGSAGQGPHLRRWRGTPSPSQGRGGRG